MCKGGAKKLTTTAIKKSVKSACLVCSGPVGIGADAAQVSAIESYLYANFISFLQGILEVIGHEKAAQGVGASGNLISGAMTGFAIGGPYGAAFGAGAGVVIGQLVKQSSGQSKKLAIGSTQCFFCSFGTYRPSRSRN